MLAKLASTFVALVSAVSAVPLAERTSLPTSVSTHCSLAKARLTVPAGQTQLVAPTGAPEYLAIGLGVQNYTCQNAVWTSVGALASLFDVSCLYGTPEFPQLTQIMFTMEPEIDAYEAAVTWATKAFPQLKNFLTPLLHHFFVPNPTAGGTGVDPRFNLEPFKTTGDYATLSKAGTIPSPDSATTDVAWLQLSNLVGGLASEVFRVATVQGQPPASCSTPNATLSVPYAAQYWFFP